MSEDSASEDSASEDSAFFAELQDGLRRGDNTAAGQLFQLYAHRLIGLARTRLDPQTRQKVDPEDVVQSVFRSFFRRQGDINITDRDSLWRLLAVITARKCANRVRFFRAAVRDVTHEEAPADRAGAEPTPEEVALCEETKEWLMRGLDDRDREMVKLRLDGFSPREIATQVQMAERTVQLVLQQMKKRLTRWLADGHD